MPDTAGLMRRVRRLEIVARRTVNDLMAGQYRSSFRGQGMEFDEVREYQPGDDVRSIDWNVTARSGTPFIKRFREEREQTVLFVADISASTMFGSGSHTRAERIMELIAVLMLTAVSNNDKIGLLCFGSQVTARFPARKGRKHALRLIREMLEAERNEEGSDLSVALQELAQTQERRAVVFLLSDFLFPLDSVRLSTTARRHDTIAVTVSDSAESEMPNAGLVPFRDAETGQLAMLDTSSGKVRDWFKDQAAKRAVHRRSVLRKAGIDELELDTSGDWNDALHSFFRRRIECRHLVSR